MRETRPSRQREGKSERPWKYREGYGVGSQRHGAVRAEGEEEMEGSGRMREVEKQGSVRRVLAWPQTSYVPLDKSLSPSVPCFPAVKWD